MACAAPVAEHRWSVVQLAAGSLYRNGHAGVYSNDQERWHGLLCVSALADDRRRPQFWERLSRLARSANSRGAYHSQNCHWLLRHPLRDRVGAAGEPVVWSGARDRAWWPGAGSAMAGRWLRA